MRRDPAAALAEAAALAPRTPPEMVPIAEAAGRRLADAVTAVWDLPGADIAAMDGWALRASPTRRTVRVVGQSTAGHPHPLALEDDEACRIATGAVLPAGSDAVLRLEEGAVGPGSLLEARPIVSGRDVRPRASEVGRGETVFEEGHVLRPHDVGVLAAVGHAAVRCVRRPRVALLASGDELVDPGAASGRPEEVIDSNLPMLTSLVANCSGRVVGVRRVPDDPAELERSLGWALGTGAEILLTVGGASVGDRDHIRRVLARRGARSVVDGLAARPGHPVWLGAVGALPVLALPGTPGAALVMFHLLGRCLLGHRDPWGLMPVDADIPGRPSEDLFVRCAITPGGLMPLDDQRPASVAGLGRCDALAWIPAGAGAARGDTVRASALG